MQIIDEDLLKGQRTTRKARSSTHEVAILGSKRCSDDNFTAGCHAAVQRNSPAGDARSIFCRRIHPNGLFLVGFEIPSGDQETQRPSKG